MLAVALGHSEATGCTRNGIVGSPVSLRWLAVPAGVITTDIISIVRERSERIIKTPGFATNPVWNRDFNSDIFINPITPASSNAASNWYL